ncbi:hypothetical protein ACVWYT_004543 [Streptomyces sp. TE4109]
MLWLPEHAPTNTGSFPMLQVSEQRSPDEDEGAKGTKGAKAGRGRTGA